MYVCMTACKSSSKRFNKYIITMSMYSIRAFSYVPSVVPATMPVLDDISDSSDPMYGAKKKRPPVKVNRVWHRQSECSLFSPNLAHTMLHNRTGNTHPLTISQAPKHGSDFHDSPQPPKRSRPGASGARGHCCNYYVGFVRNGRVTPIGIWLYFIQFLSNGDFSI